MKILITRHDKIGDFVTILPLLKNLKEQYHNYTFHVLVSEINKDFARNIPFIDDVIIYNKKSFWDNVKRIRSEKYDISISCFIDTRLGMILALSHIKIRVAPSTKIAQIFFNKRVVQRRSKSIKTEWEYNLDLGKVIFDSFSTKYNPPALAFPGNKSSNYKTIVLHPGFGGSTIANLSLEDYLELAERISNIPDIKVVFSFGPDDKKIKDKLLNTKNFKYEIIENMTIWNYLRYLSTALAFVSTSTGPMHLAACVNIHTISFFKGYSNESFTRWSSINATEKQHNFTINNTYDKMLLEDILNTIISISKE